MSSAPTAAVFDCEGPRMNAEEAAFFRDVDPFGFIVFARHCQSADDLRAHCDELREAVGREDVPILIDQEGGRVARMKPPAFPAHPPPAVFGALRRLDPAKAREASRLNGFLLGRMVSDCGVTVNCIPMLDVPQIDSDPVVIGDRVYARRADLVAELAREAATGLIEGGALPVIKHMPGHGRALCDSHYELPVVEASRRDLQEADFAPFRELNDLPYGMTAHIVYTALDPDRPATLSPVIIEETIRGEIGFDGLLFGDDLKMKALGGALSERMAASLDAGCDVALCCNFSMDEKKDAMKGARALSSAAQTRAAAAAASLQTPSRDDVAQAYERLDALIAPVRGEV